MKRTGCMFSLPFVPPAPHHAVLCSVFLGERPFMVILVVCGLTVPASSLCCSPLYESTVCMKMAAQDATGPNLHTWFHFAGWRLMGALLPHHTFAPHLCRQFVLEFWSPRGIGRCGFVPLSFSSCWISNEDNSLEDVWMSTFFLKNIQRRF